MNKVDRAEFGESEGMSEYILSEIAEVIDCEHKTAPQVDSSKYFSIRTTDISNGKIKFESANRVSEETYLEWIKRATPEPEDIVLAREAPVGEVGWIKDGYQVCLGQRTVLIKVTHNEVSKRFLLYYLVNPDTKYQLQVRSAGSVVEHLNMKDIRNFKISVPPLPEQKAIAAILSSLDDKIDLLHRQNKTLESIAETLFRQWFIEKAQDDWEESVLAKVVTITRGASPRPIMDYVQNGTVPWIKIADATGSSSFYIDSTKEFIIESGVSKSVEVYPGDLILSNSATCGLPYFVEIYGCIHDDWLLFRNFDLVSKYFVFFFLKQINRELNQVADGSVQNNLNTAILKEYPLRIPDKQALNQFDACVEPIIEKMKGNNRKIQTLEKLRDTLLPKLMSGEVRVDV